jgi:hypothetical protein
VRCGRGAPRHCAQLSDALIGGGTLAHGGAQEETLLRENGLPTLRVFLYHYGTTPLEFEKARVPRLNAEL